MLKAAMSEGVRTNAGIADYLTMRGVRTPMGNRTWNNDRSITCDSGSKV
jgi:hypothetical protein